MLNIPLTKRLIPTVVMWPPQNKEYLQNDQHAIRDSSVIFVAPYLRYPISCLKVQLAPLAQGADSEK